MKTTINKKILLAGLMLVAGSFAFAQSITTASAYFKTVSDYYLTLKTYEADFDLVQGKTESAGHFSFKSPDLLRLDFTNPEDQVFVYASNKLTVFDPKNSVILEQEITKDSSGPSLTSPQGLNLLNRYYTVTYETSQDKEPLEDDSDEMVYKLILFKKSASEAFKTIKLCISADTNLIRRVEATPDKGDPVVMNFYDYKLNKDITDQRFQYDAPPTANNINNFLFSE